MKPFELICIVKGTLSASPDPNVQCVCAQGFTALVSAKPRKTISLPMSRAEVLEDAAFRQRLFEALLSKGTVLVARPRQWLTLEKVAICLSANASTLNALCDRLEAQVQFQISVTWDAPQVLTEFRTAPELKDLFATTTPSTQVLERCLGKLRARLRGQINGLIEPVTADIIALPMAGEMLCNMAVLIPASGEYDLDLAIEAVDAIWPEGLGIRQIGPTAASAFALLDLEWIDGARIEAAFEILGAERASSSQVLHAARKQALMCRGVDAQAVKRAAEIAQVARAAPVDGFHLIQISAEDQGHAQTPLNAVA